MEEKTTGLNPAEAKPLELAPALIEAVQEDPELLVHITRSQLAVVQDRMVKKLLENKDASMAQYAAVHEQLSKNARIKEAPAGAGGQSGGTQVVINFIRAPGHEKVVIEGQSTVVPALPTP